MKYNSINKEINIINNEIKEFKLLVNIILYN